MPQISQLAETFASQLFWLLLTFGIVYFLVGRGMVPKVVSTIDMRNKAVADDLAIAEAARAAADKAEEEWRVRENAARVAAQQRVAAARSTAASATEARLAKGDSENEARIAAAEARIADAKTAAVAELEEVAAEAARDIVAKVSGATATAAQARKAVKAALNG